MTENWIADECRVFMGDGGISLHNVPNGVERARLIASAPDLLEAVDAVLAELPWHRLEASGVLKTLRAARARATGEAA
jgi:hypothetical protein